MLPLSNKCYELLLLLYEATKVGGIIKSETPGFFFNGLSLKDSDSVAAKRYFMLLSYFVLS